MGTFNTSSALDVKTSNSPIKVTVNAFNTDDHRPTKVKLHTSNRSVPLHHSVAHVSSYLISFLPFLRIQVSSPPTSLCSLRPRVNRTAASSSARTRPTPRCWSTLRNTLQTHSSNYKRTRQTHPPASACNPPLRVLSNCERRSFPRSSPLMSTRKTPLAAVGSASSTRRRSDMVLGSCMEMPRGFLRIRRPLLEGWRLRRAIRLCTSRFKA